MNREIARQCGRRRPVVCPCRSKISVEIALQADQEEPRIVLPIIKMPAVFASAEWIRWTMRALPERSSSPDGVSKIAI
jgi:hypothetical protein